MTPEEEEIVKKSIEEFESLDSMRLWVTCPQDLKSKFLTEVQQACGPLVEVENRQGRTVFVIKKGSGTLSDALDRAKKAVVLAGGMIHAETC